MTFKKSKEYIESIYNFMNVLFIKADNLKDSRLMNICKMIFNYLITCCSESKFLLRDLTKHEKFDMKPVYDYIQDNSIQILDLDNISIEDVNITNPLDIERFVLSHIYYIYDNN